MPEEPITRTNSSAIEEVNKPVEKPNLQNLYNSSLPVFGEELGDFETFKGKMAIPEKRKIFYDAASKEFGDLGSYDAFDSKIQESLSLPDIEKPVKDDVPETGSLVDDVVGFFTNINERNENIQKALEVEFGRPMELSDIDNSKVLKQLKPPESFLEGLELAAKGFIGDVEATARISNWAKRPITNMSEAVFPEDATDEDINNSFSGFSQKAFSMNTKKAMWGFSKGVMGLVDGMTSPSNIALIGLAAKAPLGMNRMFSAFFGAEMVGAMPEQVDALAKAIEQADVTKTAQSITELAGTAVFAGVSFKHAATNPPPAQKYIDLLDKIDTPEMSNKLLDAVANTDTKPIVKKPLESAKGTKQQLKESADKQAKEQKINDADTLPDDHGELLDNPLQDSHVSVVDLNLKANQKGHFNEMTSDQVAGLLQDLNNSKIGPKEPIPVKSEYGKHTTEGPTQTAKDTQVKLQEWDLERTTYEKLQAGVQDKFNAMVDWLDVEAPFERMGAKATGFAVKNFNSIRQATQEKSNNLSKRLAKEFDFSPDDMRQLVLLAEKPELFKKMSFDEVGRFQGAVGKIRDYFDEIQSRYESFGVKVDFKDRILNDTQKILNDLNLDLRQSMKKQGIQKQRGVDASKYDAEIKATVEKIEAAQSVLSQAKDMEFVHIPTAVWFEQSLGSMNSVGGMTSQLKLVGTQKRKNLTIQNLIDSGALDADKVNIVDVLGNYARRAGRDLALLDIVESAKSDGLAMSVSGKNRLQAVAKAEKLGFVDPPKSAHVLKGHKVSPFLHDWIQEFSMPNKGVGFLETATSALKMKMFYNPIFLPFYDLWQGQMANTLGVWHPIKTARFLKQGFESVFKPDDAYYRALEDGLSSTPFSQSFRDHKSYLDGLKQKKMDRLSTVVQKSLRGRLDMAVGELYRLNHELSWKLDTAVRMSSYYSLLDKGFSSRQSGQIAAKAHGDYASVPPKTRRFLNKIFFTPTFKVAMAKFYKDLIVSGVEHGIRRGRASQKAKHLSQGLAATVIGTIAFDQLMMGMGFERDRYGVKYTRPHYDLEGNSKDLVMTFSNPANLALKYANKVYASWQNHEPSSNFFKNMLNELSFEGAAHFQIASRLIKNENFDGTPIFNPFGTGFDDLAYRTADLGMFMLQATNPMVFATSENQLGFKGRQELASAIQQTGRDELTASMTAFALSFVSFPYTRNPRERRIQGAIKRAQSMHQRLLRKDFDVTPEQVFETYEAIYDSY